MAPEEICTTLTREFGAAVLDQRVEGCHPYVEIAADRWREVARFLRSDPRMRFNFLRCITGLDLLADDKLACVYDLMQLPLDDPTTLIMKTSEFAVRVTTDRNAPSLPSVSQVWAAAEWHEREAYDMFGIEFTDHPDLRRILCPDDWVGYPLRKDYDFPLEYHGIPATTEFELTNPRH